MIMLNSPHNPTGAVLGEEDIKAATRHRQQYSTFLSSVTKYMNISSSIIFRIKVFYDILTCWKEALCAFLLAKFFIARVGNWAIVYLRLI